MRIVLAFVVIGTDIGSSHAAPRLVTAQGAATAATLRAAVPMVYKRYGTPGAQSSWDAQRSTTVVVQNIDDVSASAMICFNAAVLEGTSLGAQTWEQCYDLFGIAPGASYPVDLDVLAEVPDSFSGSARIYSTSRVAALGTHFFSDTNNFLTISAATALVPVQSGTRAYVPTFYSDRDGREGTNAMSALFAQNIDEQNNRVTVQFFFLGSSTAARTATFELAPGRSARLDAPSLFSRFNGSAIVSATRFDGTPGLVGAHVFELAQGNDANTVYNQAKAYVGFARGATTLHMPTALCQAFGSPVTPAQSTAYAIQNVSAVPALVDVIFEPDHHVTSISIPPNSKASLQTCAVVPQGYSGAAQIRSPLPVVAVGKALADGQTPGTGTVTAFEGVDRGADQLAIPYIRWASDTDYFFSYGGRSSIAVQNTGSTDALDVRARYFSAAGSQEIPLGNIAPGGKVNTTPSQITDANVLDAIRNGMGSVQIVGQQGAELSALVRVYRRKRISVWMAPFSEDYVAAKKKKQEHRCTCKLTVPQKGALPIEFTSYYRERAGKFVATICADLSNKLLEPTPTIEREITVDACKACPSACATEAKRGYYFAVETIPPPGGPPNPKLDSPDPEENRDMDREELLAKDPCKSIEAPVFAFENSCQ